MSNRLARCTHADNTRADSAGQLDVSSARSADILKTMWRVNSELRTVTMLNALDRAPPQVFWPVFQECYGACDNTWDYRHQLLRLLRRNTFDVDRRDFMNSEAIMLFHSLPALVRVYRGCSRGRELAVSWTLDRDVAVEFTVDHRGISVPNPTLCEAEIPKSAIFTLLLDRQEDEVVLDPAMLVFNGAGGG